MAAIAHCNGTATIDRQLVLDRVGGDESLLQEITALFIEEYPALLSEIRSAQQQADALLLERAAHSLKGSVANFGADAAVAAALWVEKIGREARLHEADEAIRQLEIEFNLLHPALLELLA
jgi:HPt (histidine-containing phosphotransfer) domain-containing protein